MALSDKPPGSEPLPAGSRWRDTYQYARNEWDDRLGDAATQARLWRIGCFASCAVSVLAIVSAIHFADARDHRPVVVVVRNVSGDVIGVTRSEGAPSEPTQADVASGLKRWVRDLRTISTDANVMRNQIKEAYRMIANPSIAHSAMDAGFIAHDPFARAKVEVASLSEISALPTPGTPDEQGNRTWTMRWTETLTGRDGAVLGVTPWAASVTFRIGAPVTGDDVDANPDGIFINSFTWEPTR